MSDELFDFSCRLYLGTDKPVCLPDEIDNSCLYCTNFSFIETATREIGNDIISYLLLNID